MLPLQASAAMGELAFGTGFNGTTSGMVQIVLPAADLRCQTILVSAFRLSGKC